MKYGFYCGLIFLFLFLFLASPLRLNASSNKNIVLDWARNIGEEYDFEYSSMVIDSDDNVILIGKTYNYVNFGDGNDFVIDPDGASSGISFLVKYNPQGNVIWLKSFEGSITSRDLNVDLDDNIYVVGNFGGEVNFSPNSGSGDDFLIYNSGAGSRMFILKIEKDGSIVFAKANSRAVINEPRKINIHNGSVYIVGRFQGRSDLDNQVNFSFNNQDEIILRSYFYHQSFYLKMNLNGDVDWVNTIRNLESAPLSAPSNNSTSFVFFDNHLFIIGSFSGALTNFNPHGGDILLNSFNGSNYIIKTDLLGVVIWAKQFGPNAFTQPYMSFDIISTESKIIILGATGINNFDYNPEPENELFLDSEDYNSNYILSINSDGEFLQLNNFGGVRDHFSRIVNSFYHDEMIYIYGNIEGPSNIGFDFNPNPEEFILHNTVKGYADGYILKIDKDFNYIWHQVIESDTDSMVWSNQTPGQILIDSNSNIYYFTERWYGPVFMEINGDENLYNDGFSLFMKFSQDFLSLPPSNFQATNPTLNTVDINWEDEEENTDHYIIKISTSPINSDNFDESSGIAETMPNPIDNLTITIAELSSNTTYYFAIKTIDVFNNVSEPRFASATTLSPPSPPSTNGGVNYVPHAPPCMEVEYGPWQECNVQFSVQFREVSLSTPSGCSLTETQRALLERACYYEIKEDVKKEDDVLVKEEDVSKYLNIIEKAKTNFKGEDKSLVNRLIGQIIIQVEDMGKAWYINPDDGKRYYLGNPTNAFSVMSIFGRGILNEFLQKIPIGLMDKSLSNDIDSDGDGLTDRLEEAIGTDPFDSDTDGDGYSDYTEVINNYNPLNPEPRKVITDFQFTSNNLGYIFIQVETNGEAWYLEPKSQRRYYLGRPLEAYNIMRQFGLGISEEDINKIPVGEFNKEQLEKMEKMLKGL